MQTNKDIALLLWQGLEQVKLHSAFVHELKHSCMKATILKRPLEMDALVNRIDALEAECDQVLQRTAIPAEEKATHE